MMNFIRKWGLWIVLAVAIYGVWYYYDQAKKAQAKLVIAPLPNTAGGYDGGGIADYVDGNVDPDYVV